MADDDSGFFSRWSRRKAQVQRGVAPPEPAGPPGAPAGESATPVSPPPAPPASARGEVHAPAPAAPAPPPPTLEEAQALTPDADFSRFVARDVDPGVKNTALKRLFSDPHFNTMDGLDIYIDDYGKPDPLPKSLLRQLVQSRALGLFDDEHERPPAARDAAVSAAAAAASPAPSITAAPPAPVADPAAAPEATPLPPPAEPERHEDPDLRLQPDDAAGPPGPGGGALEDARRER